MGPRKYSVFKMGQGGPRKTSLRDGHWAESI